MKDSLIGGLIVFGLLPLAALAAPNCDDIKKDCVETYNAGMAKCGSYEDRRGQLCRADAQNQYLSCVQAGGCK
ncbi:hypothetical protein [Paraburkholderia sp. GAS334]|uniref:hypothetical protein n=1 Tax=Paraburkholderia sp. GAS334 TaxID=3035131 RepID=UPI003D1A0B8A